MHISLWKPISHCASLILEQRKNAKPKLRGSPAREASEDGPSPNPSIDDPFLSSASATPISLVGRSAPLPHAQKEFLQATALAADHAFTDPASIPDLRESFSKFITMYPKFKNSEKVDELRADEYSHLAEAGAKACLDYCGFGLFSYIQSFHQWESCAFSLSEITANLSNHALYGGAEAGTVEHDIKVRIMDYLNIPENEYGLVFTVSRGSAFKLLAESYPFQTNKKLLTMFDHESQSVNLMAQCAKEKGAKTYSAWFKWPTLKLSSIELRKQISTKKRRKKDSAVGLFVFPVQSRVTGAKYSYQWMALAQQNNWHVLLDAGSLGPKDMDSLGLSLFRPDFIITSFYRVFGSDPSGFGCLLIKKSVMGCLQNQNGGTGSGMVKIIPVFPQYLSDSVDGLEELDGIEDDLINGNDESLMPGTSKGSQMPAFSGAYTSAQVQDVIETEMDHDNSSDRDGASTIFEEESVSIGEVMKSPVFSEDESSDHSFWIDLGQSPYGSDHSGQLNRGGKLGSPLPPSWFTGRKTQKRQSPRLATKISRSPIYDDHVVSFDAAVLELDRVKEDSEEESHELGRKVQNFHYSSEIQEEPETRPHTVKFSSANGSVADSSASIFGHHICHENGSTSEVCPKTKESAIRRETEGEFRLLGRREGNGRYGGGRFFTVEENEQVLSMGHRVSFSVDDNRHTERLSQEAGEVSGQNQGDDDNGASDGDDDDTQEWGRREPEIVCRHLDHVNMLGLNKTTFRLRYLINWLVTSLLQLRLPDLNGENGDPLVCIYGPKIKYERGASVAFNVKDSSGSLINPEVVQRLAEKHGISLGIGFLSHIRVLENQKHAAVDSKNTIIRVEVVTASLGFLSNFEDVYRVWAFVARFLDPAFVEAGRLSTVEESVET
ncbi:uncharacterized protein LOC109835198 [Asparagus officinalis]|uniref:uncharacterized protein LOC109835198 n=1 Tax=Asparagus officinalis TaxID=4686 RepID=UPI00098E0C02|nr:uncharacterized protein LOC109835198 [Asparagus officinalis]